MDNAVVIGGLGVVGKATMLSFGIKDYFDLKESNIDLKEIAKRKRLVFICLPTPASYSTHDVTPIKEIIEQIEKFGGGQKLYIVRSTTTPGQLDHLSELLDLDCILHYPEFLTMNTWKQDIEDPDIIVIGYRKRRYAEELLGLLKARYRDLPSYFLANLATSEMIKLGINAFYALKVVFANEMYDFAKVVGADYNVWKEALYKRKWIGANHFEAIFNGERGVRGRCLPKDLDAMATVTNSDLLTTARNLNKKWA